MTSGLHAECQADMADDGFDVGRPVDDQRGLFARFFERRKLAVEQRLLRKMTSPGPEALAQDVGRGFQVDKADKTEPLADLCPVVGFQRRTGEHRRFAALDGSLDNLVQGVQPASAFGVGERSAGGDLRDACRRVVVVGIDEPPSEPFGKGKADC